MAPKANEDWTGQPGYSPGGGSGPAPPQPKILPEQPPSGGGLVREVGTLLPPRRD